LSLYVVSLPSSREAISRVGCPNCQCELSVHQPDLELPDRMLGTCPECKSWYLMDWVEGVMLLMPRGHLSDAPLRRS
jgi:hypothetical protein